MVRLCACGWARLGALAWLCLGLGLGLGGCGGSGSSTSDSTSSTGTTTVVVTPTAPGVPGSLTPGSLVPPVPVVPGWAGQLTWGTVTDASAYRVALRDVVAGSVVFETTTVAPPVFVNLVSGGPQQFSWTVAACNGVGCSAASPAALFNTTPASPVPLVPTALQPGASGGSGTLVTTAGQRVDLTWSGVNLATSYTVVMTAVATGQVSRFTSPSPALTVDLAAATQWLWVVQACNESGCSGNSAVATFQTPAAAATPPVTVTRIAAGSNTSFAIKSDGSLWAWGANTRGQLGDGTLLARSTPGFVGADYSQVASSGQNTLAVRTDATLWSWGASGTLLGDGSAVDRNRPLRVGSGYKQVSIGSESAAAVKLDGTLQAWGVKGYLGDGKLSVGQSTPLQITTSFASVSVGRGNMAGINSAGNFLSWGSYSAVNRSCAPTATATFQITPLSAGGDFVQTAAAANNFYAVASAGGLASCGDNSSGQVGNGSTSATTTTFAVGTGYSKVSAGLKHVLALKTDGSLWAWGDNSSGQLGDGTLTSRSSPTLIGSGFIAIAAGDTHSLALRADGTLWAWGSNASGELGDRSTLTRLVPVQIGF